MSDWLATDSTKSLVRGLDQELGIEANGPPPPGSDVPEGKYFGPALRAAIEQGRIPFKRDPTRREADRRYRLCHGGSSSISAAT